MAPVLTCSISHRHPGGPGEGARTPQLECGSAAVGHIIPGQSAQPPPDSARRQPIDLRTTSSSRPAGNRAGLPELLAWVITGRSAATKFVAYIIPDGHALHANIPANTRRPAATPLRCAQSRSTHSGKACRASGMTATCQVRSHSSPLGERASGTGGERHQECALCRSHRRYFDPGAGNELSPAMLQHGNCARVSRESGTASQAAAFARCQGLCASSPCRAQRQELGRPARARLEDLPVFTESLQTSSLVGTTVRGQGSHRRWPFRTPQGERP